MLRRILVAAGLAGVLGVAPAPAVLAQDVGVVQSEILVLDPERLFAETLLGQRMLEEFQAAREAMSTRNRELEAELEAEEKSLTEKRATLSPEAFRELADHFDTKVQRIRRESDRAVRNLERRRELLPVQFMRMVEPVLVGLMEDTGGAVIMDARSVLLRADAVDVTDLAATRIDAEIGEGPEAPQADTQGNEAAGDDAAPSEN
nr:OmpH family outer membrane protein [Roseovarius bejariae]